MTPVEELALGYIHAISGDYERIEPQVYDIVLPEDIHQKLGLPRTDQLCRVTFDSEALCDHPTEQLLAFGHPTLDAIFHMAHEHGSTGKMYLSGFNLHPHQLNQKLTQQLHLQKDLTLEFGRSRIKHFTSWFFWFQSTFCSDEKLQDMYEVGIDQYYGRQTRRFGEMYESAQVTSEPLVPCPDAGGISLKDAYLHARREAVTKLRSSIRSHKERLTAYLSSETQQIVRYFDEMKTEVDEREKKTPSTESPKFQEQKRSLELEKQMRLAELQKKMSLKVDLKLLLLLYVVMPKIITPVRLSSKGKGCVETMIVWNPMSNTVEPIACPACCNPTLDIHRTNSGAIGCPQCNKSEAGRSRGIMGAY